MLWKQRVVYSTSTTAGHGTGLGTRSVIVEQMQFGCIKIGQGQVVGRYSNRLRSKDRAIKEELHNRGFAFVGI